MRLSSKPKPVRIRISVGGEEHTTLESLKENITPEILDFIDGRLERWLKQQGEEEVANKIEKINKDCIDLLDIYNLLFAEDYKTLLSFIDKWQNCKKSKSLLGYIFTHWEKETFVTIFENNYNIFSLNEWFEIIAPFNNSELDFALAKKYEEKEEIPEYAKTAIRLFKEIEQRGDHPVAIDYYKKNYFDQLRLFADNTIEELNDIVNDLSLYKELRVTLGDFRDKEMAVYSFIRQCSEIISKPNDNYQKSRTCETLFKWDKINSDDILKNEKLHVSAIIFYCFSHYRYGVGNYTLFSKIKKLIDKDYKFHNRVCCFTAPNSCIESIKEIIKYLLFEKFRDNE